MKLFLCEKTSQGNDVGKVLGVTTQDAAPSNFYPRSLFEVKAEYYCEIENWVQNAHFDEIRKFLLFVHQSHFSSWDDLVRHHLKHCGNGKNFIKGCDDNCQDIFLAINTITEFSRPELKQLFICHQQNLSV